MAQGKAIGHTTVGLVAHAQGPSHSRRLRGRVRPGRGGRSACACGVVRAAARAAMHRSSANLRLTNIYLTAGRASGVAKANTEPVRKTRNAATPTPSTSATRWACTGALWASTSDVEVSVSTNDTLMRGYTSAATSTSVTTSTRRKWIPRTHAPIPCMNSTHSRNSFARLRARLRTGRFENN